MTDPFPIPDVQGLVPTHELEWAAMARKIVRDVLQVAPHERVILSADPYFGGAPLQELRLELQRVRAIELATILHWTPDLSQLRAVNGVSTDADHAAAEDAAMAGLFDAADIFIWMMNDTRHGRKTIAEGQTEKALESWPGRSVHFHWFHDPNNRDPVDPINKAIDLVYQRAILELDYPALSRRMRSLADSLSNQTVRITDSAGTDIRFALGPKFHLNDGDATREKMAGVTNARDREEEIPCGALRAIPLEGTADGVIAFERGFGFPVAGYGIDLGKFLDSGLRIHFSGGRITRLETDRGDQARLDELWAAETGDKDRLGEIVLGCNPLLTPVKGSTFQPYFGFGDGIVRLTIGENIESGGRYRSSTHRWLYLNEATLEAGPVTLVDGGRIA